MNDFIYKEIYSEIKNNYRSNWTKSDIERMRGMSTISTMSTSRMNAILETIRYVKKKNIPGDLVECGVYMGGNIALSIGEMKRLDINRSFWAYDTFSGVPKNELIDNDTHIPMNKEGSGESVESRYVDDKWCYCDLDEVNQNVLECTKNQTNYKYNNEETKDIIDDIVIYVEGSVIDTIPKTLPEQISFIRLDMDIAAPTKHTLEHIWDLIPIGGVIHIDDYNMFSGVHEVVDEFFDDKFIYTQEIDDCAISIVRLS
jgi:O-methyltransferase